MPLAIGTRIGPYEITAALGAGGMGEVYRARDTRLKRDVALKLLPESYAADPQRLARFQREAEVLASLDHPHIGAIYGIEESGETRALVLQLVEGETLAERIAHGPIPLAEALPMARQIAEALEAAHEQGVVHRDLKPANVKITPEGVVKVLDFGLAKLLEPGGVGPAASAVSQAATITSPALVTGAGMLLGTAAYMSPEQAKGRPADKRSDVWAFGCVLYEMLTGRRAFPGEDVADTLAAVLRGEPDWNALPKELPPSIATLMKRCVEKDRRARVSDIAAANFLLGESSLLGPVAAGPSSTPLARRRRVVDVTAALAVGASISALALWALSRPSTPPSGPTRFEIVPPESLELSIQGADRDVAISPDGTYIVYRGAPGREQLIVRRLNELDVKPLAGTTGARFPFVSPDGRWIGFSAQGEIRKVPSAGGPVVPICRIAGALRGASWAEDDTIVFATNDAATGLMSVSASGGEPKVLTKPKVEDGENEHYFPTVLPGGRALLLTVLSDRQISSIAVLDRQTGQHRTLLSNGNDAHYVDSGHLVYASGQSGPLFAVRFDPAGQQVLSAPVPLAEQTRVSGAFAGNFDISRAGTFVFLPAEGAAASASKSLVWVDRTGREEPVDGLEQRAYTGLSLSPDGQRIALEVSDQESDIWTWDIGRKTLTRLTFEPGADQNPVWMTDRYVAFSSQRDGATNIYRKAADGTGVAEPLTVGVNQFFPSAISRDGTHMVLFGLIAGSGGDLGRLVLGNLNDAPVSSQPSTAVTALVNTGYSEVRAELSPDGRWLAYQSNKSGEFKVYVRPFPNVANGEWEVSAGRGVYPIWSRDGRELFFVDGANALVTVPVRTTANAFSAGRPVTLFSLVGRSQVFSRIYDVSLDGRRFVVIKPGAVAPRRALAVVLNWTEELKRLVPTN